MYAIWLVLSSTRHFFDTAVWRQRPTRKPCCGRETARCRCKIRYVSKFTAAPRGSPCDSTASCYSKWSTTLFKYKWIMDVCLWSLLCDYSIVQLFCLSDKRTYKKTAANKLRSSSFNNCTVHNSVAVKFCHRHRYVYGLYALRRVGGVFILLTLFYN